MSWQAILKYPAIFLAGLLVTWLLTPIWRHFAPRWGFLDRPGGRKIHHRPIPTGGGLALFIGFQAACAVLMLVPWRPFVGQISIQWWFRFLPLSCAVVLLGLCDDRWDLRPWIKLAVQIAISAAAYALGFRLQNLFGFVLPGWVDLIATLFGFTALMNAFNLIDGMDGLATGIAAIAAGGIALSLVFRGAPGDVLLFLGFIGACLGFLRYNFYPASVFLGDTGSHFLGFTLAALTISTNSKASFLAGLGVPMLAVGVPLFDVILAVWRRSVRRLLHGGSAVEVDPGVERADADHLHHRLLRRGFGQQQVAGFLYAATFVLVLVGLLASIFNDRALGILVLAFLLAAYTVVRHLAGIELQASGQVVLQGLSLPIRRNRTLLFYLAGDVIILSVALWIVLALMQHVDPAAPASLKEAWLKAAPLDLFIPFAVLLAFRSYSRVWYLARVSEYAATGLAVVLGYAIAAGLHLLVMQDRNELVLLAVHYLLLAGMAAPAVVMTRAALRLVQDLLHWRMRSSGMAGVTAPRTLVVGAGYRTTLFLRQISFRMPEYQALRVVGLVSDDTAMIGHMVHGLRVLGQIRELPALVAQHRIDVVYLVEPVTAEEEASIRRMLQPTSVRLIRWDIVETELLRDA